MAVILSIRKSILSSVFILTLLLIPISTSASSNTTQVRNDNLDIIEKIVFSTTDLLASVATSVGSKIDRFFYSVADGITSIFTKEESVATPTIVKKEDTRATTTTTIVNNVNNPTKTEKIYVTNNTNTIDDSIYSRVNDLENIVSNIPAQTPVTPDVSKNFLTRQVDTIYTSVGRSISDTSDTLTASINAILTNGTLATPTFTGTTTADILSLNDLTVSDVITLSTSVSPSVTTNKLYQNSGSLYWAGNVIGGATTGNWTTDGTDVYRATGNVGIGTSSPYAKLSVVGQIVGEYFTATSTTATSTFAGGLSVAGTSGLTVLQNGNVGIGTTSPLAKLSVKGTGLTTGLAFQVTDSANSPKVTILDSGNVGIGSTTPAAKLSVTGSGLTTGKAFEITDSANSAKFTVLDSGNTSVAGNLNVASGMAYTYNSVNMIRASTTLKNYFFGDMGNLTMTGTYNVGVGNGGLSNVTTGYYNTAVGGIVLQSNSTGASNVGVGYVALRFNTIGSSNVGIGSSALYNNTTGGSNTAVGGNAGTTNSTGQYNVFIGGGAGQLATTTSGAVYVGYQAGYNATSTSGNTFIGYQSGVGNSTVQMGGFNTGIGYQTLNDLQTGTKNTALGYGGLDVLTSGESNSVFGYNAGGAITTGTQNVMIGDSSGLILTTGSTNTLIGYQAGDALTTSASGNIAIGSVDLPSASGSNQLNIGGLIFGTGMTTGTGVSTGNLGIGTTSPYAKLSVEHLSTTGTVIGADALTGFTGNLLDLKVASSTVFSINQAGAVTATGLSFGSVFANMLAGFDASGNLTSTSSPQVAYINATSTTATSTFAGGLIAGNNSAFVVNQGATANSLYVAGNGNVGVGTAGPGAPLDFAGSTGSKINLYNGASYGLGVQANLLQIYSPSGSNRVGIGSGSSASFTENLTVLSTGNVGIGTTTPSNLLSLYSATAATQGFSGGATKGVWSMGYDVTNNLFAIASSSSITSNVRMVIDNQGNVGIGTTSPIAKLSIKGTGATTGKNLVLTDSNDVNKFVILDNGAMQNTTLGSAGASLITDADGNITVSSDERLKNVQGNFTRGLNDILSINPILYKWNDTTGYDTTNTYAGFSAQNIQFSIPEAVSTDNNGYLTLAERPVLATAINAIKELNIKITRLENATTTSIQTQSILSTIAEWVGQKITATLAIFDRVETKELCIGKTCVTEDELKDLLSKNSITATTYIPTVVSTTTIDTVSTTTIDTVSTTTGSTTTIPTPNATSTLPVITVEDTSTSTPPQATTTVEIIPEPVVEVPKVDTTPAPIIENTITTIPEPVVEVPVTDVPVVEVPPPSTTPDVSTVIETPPIVPPTIPEVPTVDPVSVDVPPAE